jgi:hypothetical protein
LLKEAQGYRALYESRFGHLDLTGIPVRYRAAIYLDGDSHSGMTYVDAIDIAVTGRAGLPHELNHVRTGPSHEGWCLDYEPWSKTILGLDESAYLHCQN